MANNRKRQAFRPGTVANQDSAAFLYLAFAIYFRFVALPATEQTLLYFAEFLLRSFTAAKSVTNVLSAVKRLHIDLGFPTMVFGAPGFCRWKRALSLTVRWVRQLCLAVRAWGRGGRMPAALFTLLFHTMTRLFSILPISEDHFDPTRHATPGDCRWERVKLWFRVKCGKTHQRPEQGFWVPVLPRPGSAGCPVAALVALLQGDRFRAVGPLFRGAKGTTLTIPAARDWLRVSLVAIGYRHDAYTFHAFRRGACTAAFANGAQLEDLKALGGWRSNAVELYRSAADARIRAATALNLNPSH